MNLLIGSILSLSIFGSLWGVPFRKEEVTVRTGPVPLNLQKALDSGGLKFNTCNIQ